MSSLALASTAPRRRPAADLPRPLRTFLATGAGLVTVATGTALARVATGWAPYGFALREVALAIHLAAVLPAIPLGAWVLLAGKGGARHRMLGKVWLALMLVAALSALGIRHLNDGRLSPVHLLVPVVLVGAWRVISSARAGNLVRHRRAVVGLFAGGLLVPGLIAFMPGRLMWAWLLG